MKFAGALCLLLGAASAASSLPKNHPIDLAKFGGQFRCPYASEWLTKGPEQAAIDLGLPSSITENNLNKHRDLQQGGPPRCELAPGAIGAGHQASYSAGYDSSCPGTPAEGSPYMWPLAWSAHLEAESMAYGSDEVVYHSRSYTFYRLDKNWKRSDTYYQRGVQRAVGQGPCASENRVNDPSEPVVACRRDSDERSTMIHRGSKMFFISWKNTTVSYDSAEDIESCRWMDLQVVGNIRPDWYMDARGDSTDVQYLGDQHVYYQSEPRLVKQWRKKDFASQYFVMSVQANLLNDGDNTKPNLHWPLILNVPGEGFGDDFLQKYTNHTLLTDADDDLFLLDQALEAIGGECVNIQAGGPGGSVGPPTGEAEPIPSNLEVDPNSWFSNEYTYSTVWEPPVKTDMPEDVTDEKGRVITEVSSDVLVASCYDEKTNAVELSVTFKEIASQDSIPWMAIGYRDTEECLMTPRGGESSDIIQVNVVEDEESGELTPSAMFGQLGSSVKRFDPSALQDVTASLVPLSDMDGFTNVKVTLPQTNDNTAISPKSNSESNVNLQFKQSMPKPTEGLNLMYAIGRGPELGFHASRECFQITKFPSCLEVKEEDSDLVDDAEVSASTEDPSGAESLIHVVVVFAAISLSVLLM